MSEIPHRRLRLILDLEADSLRDLERALDGITLRLCHEGDRETREITSSGWSDGYHLTLTCDPDMDGDRYRALLEQWRSAMPEMSPVELMTAAAKKLRRLANFGDPHVWYDAGCISSGSSIGEAEAELIEVMRPAVALALADLLAADALAAMTWEPTGRVEQLYHFELTVARAVLGGDQR